MSQPLDLIACPICHSGIDSAGERHRCVACGREYGPAEGLDLTPVPPPDEELLERWPLWEQLQANFLTAAEAVPEHSLSVTERPDIEAFAAFCDFSGIVLDVGCGTQRRPTYMDTSGCRFVGLDPLPGEPDREFEFVQGIGEYLPFATGTFDQVVFATSLDHMLVPSRTIAEAQRVVRPGGAVNVWFGELEREDGPREKAMKSVMRVAGSVRRRLPGSAPVAVEEPEYIAALEQPDGAVDKFHVAHPDAATISGWLVDAGMAIDAVERVSYGHGCFVRGVKPRTS